ncbi:MAG: NAD-dependent epimerase/dehydratase family protein [Candidatus Undinarchaeales archaeon]
MKILVTGGAGFIGTNLVPKLIEKGHEVKVLDLLLYGNGKEVENAGAEVLKGDIRDKETCSSACKGIDVIIHLAAQTGVVYSVKKPRYDFETNAVGIFNMLMAAKENNVDKFIFTSSVAVLGDQEQPVHEEQIPNPKSGYGASKLCGEGYCNFFEQAYGLDSIILRFTNVYGQKSAHKRNIMNIFIERIEQGKPLTVFGDGTTTRDYVHVNDVCRALILCLEKEISGETIHVSSGKETSINDLINALEKVTEKDFEVKNEPARTGEILRNYSKIEKAKKVLGFEPKISLEEGLRQTYRWFKGGKS